MRVPGLRSSSTLSSRSRRSCFGMAKRSVRECPRRSRSGRRTRVTRARGRASVPSCVSGRAPVRGSDARASSAAGALGVASSALAPTPQAGARLAHLSAEGGFGGKRASRHRPAQSARPAFPPGGRPRRLTRISLKDLGQGPTRARDPAAKGITVSVPAIDADRRGAPFLSASSRWIASGLGGSA
jgi:hypothetical protein